MFHDLRAAVTQRYAQELTEMDRTEFEDFVTAEAARLEAIVAQAQADNELSVVAAWKTASGGAEPDQLMLTTLYQQARYSAEETALATLWEGYRSPEDAETPIETSDPESMTGMQRWLTEWAIEATPSMVELAERVWPDRTPQFQVWGEQLLQARATDSLPLPDGPGHPLVPELTRQVDAALAEQARTDAQRAQR